MLGRGRVEPWMRRCHRFFSCRDLKPFVLAFCATHNATGRAKSDRIQHIARTAGRAVRDHFRIVPTLVSFMADWWKSCKRSAKPLMGKAGSGMPVETRRRNWTTGPGSAILAPLCSQPAPVRYLTRGRIGLDPLRQRRYAVRPWIRGLARHIVPAGSGIVHFPDRAKWRRQIIAAAPDLSRPSAQPWPDHHVWP